ncbi:sensor histidine kinase [Sedimentibacter sp. MB31-C6]|uniref:sensor histidine kinase n=1 Tax=Sedimentibacter sp. MB31-C6 TaxID=3109366 RepID=UPI002DDCFA0B|nr:HAMP domain-containing sensor histidine kinase [Sedimentibacter sp. MB36-C1]WSI03528.1 HAMP domain-containing sensor histidine kinase [Sedimentibacter sp. MB36-C1]
MLAIKWKTLSRKTITKTTAFILLVFSLMLGVFSCLEVFLNVENYESITVENYIQSNTLSDELRHGANRLEYLLRVYKGKDFIINGGTIENLKIEDSWQLTNLYNNFVVENNYEDNIETEELFWIEKSDEIEDIKKAIIKTDLSNYEKILDDLNNPEGLIYYAYDGKNISTNTEIDRKSFYEIRTAYLLIDEDGTVIKPENGKNSYSPSLVDKLESIENGIDETVIYVGITDEGLATRIDKWNNDRHTLIKNAIIILICIVITLICFVYLMIVAGRRNGTEEIHIIFLDKLYTDLNLISIIGLVAIGIVGFNEVLSIRYININLMKLAMLSSVAALSTAFIGLFLSIVKHIKKGTIIRYSVIYIVLSKIIEIIVKLFRGGPLMFKSITGIIILMGTTILGTKNNFLLLLILIFASFFVYKKVISFKTILDGIKFTKEGDYAYKINLEGNGEFKQLAEDINELTDGIKMAVQNEVKSERLKSELITNVSHDIKTPLTSIISYVDLLKREGLDSKNAMKYLDVLDRKSNRLKNLTEDLFEAAKATSGSIEPHFSRVNVNALVSQILGESNDKIQDKKLQFKVTATEDRIYANADGRLLSRVMENLLSNIFKYALKGSRVYIDITQLEQNVYICFKNVSAKELNIPVDELMERFKRGDESRSSEGNGLGLAIARSLMEIQKGLLSISIDGDLFKAEIKLEKYSH